MAASQEAAVSLENLMDEVSDSYGNIEAIKTRLTDRSSKFAAGQIQHCLTQWQEITREEEILKMVVGVDIQILDEPPSGQIHQAHFSRKQSQATDVEIEELVRRVSSSPAITQRVNSSFGLFLLDQTRTW